MVPPPSVAPHGLQLLTYCRISATNPENLKCKGALFTYMRSCASDACRPHPYVGGVHISWAIDNLFTHTCDHVVLFRGWRSQYVSMLGRLSRTVLSILLRVCRDATRVPAPRRAHRTLARIRLNAYDDITSAVQFTNQHAAS